MASTIGDLYGMVAMPEPPDDPLAFAREQATTIRKALGRLEKALAAHDGTNEIDFASIHGKAEDVRCAAERLSFGLESWDATVDSL